MLARVESQYRWKLSIDLPAGANGGFSAVGGTVTQVTDNMLLLHPVQQYDIENDDLSVAIRNQNIVLHNSSMLTTIDDEGDGEKRQQVLTIYLNQIDNSLRCADEEQACDGSLIGLEQRGVRIQSETPLPYHLERMNR